MNCPICKGKVSVIDTEHLTALNMTIRRKKCVECGFRFHTVEKFSCPVEKEKYIKMWKKKQEEKR